MRILNISSMDLIGQRFNGHYLNRYLNNDQHSCKQLVWEKTSADPNTDEMIKSKASRQIAWLIEKIENFLSLRALLNLSCLLLVREKFFKASDVIHYHIIYWPNFFSILALPFLTSKKPSVWTIHDLWPITGHCVYPFDCNRWQTGCGSCPNLKISFPMRKDRTRLNWKAKRWMYKRANLHLIVASKFMYNYVRRSPLISHLPISLVPFGIDLTRFKPGDTDLAKRLLGIPSDEIVISFRAAPGDFKGFDIILDALRELKTDKKICLLTFNVKYTLDGFRHLYRVIDLGWVNDEELLINAYTASDFFLMPSSQEAFGMMAMEAMACGKPPIVFRGTSLPEVVGGPEIGIIAETSDTSGLTKAIEKLLSDADFRRDRGKKCRKFAEANYSLERYTQGLLQVYESAIARRNTSATIR